MAEAEPALNAEDLEDGEIGSDDEDTTEVKTEEKIDNDPTKDPEKPSQFSASNTEHQKSYQSKSGKKKKSKFNKQEQKQKEKLKQSKKNRNFDSAVEDDFAGNIEKAIRKAMNKSEAGDGKHEDTGDERRKNRKRKKYENNQGANKKRKKQEFADEVDESEMMFVRGASPVQKQSPNPQNEDDRDSYASDSSNESRGQHQQQQQRQQRHRQQQRDNRNNNKNKNDRRRQQNAHPNQDPDGVCLYFMQGKCHKGDDCIYSHNAQPPRKMELCKFYLMECCAKRDKCLYMHADFPCKYYHTGIPCIYKDECKFAHGKPLTDNFKNILLKHIESAPKEILGDFPRLNREGAMKMIQNTQAKLMQQYNEGANVDYANNMMFDQNYQNQQNHQNQQNQNEVSQQNQSSNDKANKASSKTRQSRWQNDNSNVNIHTNFASGGTTNVLDIKNLTGVLTPRQISDLGRMGIENLDQLGQLTVLQLNSIGISLKQITEIQMNTISIQKLGLLSSNTEPLPQVLISPTTVTQDLDLRVAPAVAIPAVSTNTVAPSDLMGRDVDMRFLPSTTTIPTEESTACKPEKKDRLSKDMIDIDQYTKDALKFVSKDKENIDISNETYDNEKPSISSSNEVKDVDHRVLPFTDEGSKIAQIHNEGSSRPKKGNDTDIRFLQPEPIFKKSPDKRHRRSTTDDEDNGLCIDEKWYSSDEEKSNKRKSPASSPRPNSSPQILAPSVIEHTSVISKLGDLSKIDISEEVTKLLNTMKNNLHENKVETAEVSKSPASSSQSPRLRDPRSKKSPEKSSETTPKVFNKRAPRVSIYECVDGEPTDGRRRSDVDLRKADFPAFGDTDLRQSASGDIDLRLGLPFKAIPNYTPASEINGSINNHPPIAWKLVTIDIPRPDYTDIRNSTAKSQALHDPRLRKVFRLSVEESNSDSEKTTKPVSTSPRVDPRRKKETSDIPEKTNLLDIQVVLQNSDWYKELSTTQKICVNQHLMPITQMIKQFHNDKVQGAKFDLSSIQSNSVLCAIFANLAVTLDENGEYSYLPKPKEALLKTPINVNPPANPFGNVDPNMGLMGMSPMGMGGVGVGMNNMPNMNMPPMHGFPPAMSDPRGGPTPGLLGIAPNIPHNFNNVYGPNNFGGMGFNGPNPGNNFNFMDGDPNFQRFPNRGGPRGRTNERWNRGGGSGGRNHRDRKNFNDRGNWNDRN